MAPMAVTIQATASPVERCHFLPRERDQWSADTQNTYREVLGELDSWSRKNDASRSLNSWIAEEAVRRC